MNAISFIPQIGAAISIGGIIFKIGQQSEKLHITGLKVEAQENKIIKDSNMINDIKNIVNLLQTDISYIKKDIHEIKTKIR